LHKKIRNTAKALSDSEKAEIREYYMNNAVSVRTLAKMAGVSAATVWRAITIN